MSGASFSSRVETWLQHEAQVQSAVLFGSSARLSAAPAVREADLDLHLISSRPRALEALDWKAALPADDFLFRAVRPATGGVRKITVLYAAGQMDLVVVPRASARLGFWLLRSGLHRRHRGAMIALNEMATCLHTGYRFLKGEAQWGGFYAGVAATMRGVRFDDAELEQMADALVVDYLWVLAKVRRGEWVAAQHVLHRQISETNLKLYRELRLRRGEPLPSFGLGRRLETLAAPAEVEALRIDAGLSREALEAAANKAAATCRGLMQQLVGARWRWPATLARGDG
jgi:hypothetical protein